MRGSGCDSYRERHWKPRVAQFGSWAARKDNSNLRTPENRLTLVRVARNVSPVASYPDYDSVYGSGTKNGTAY